MAFFNQKKETNQSDPDELENADQSKKNIRQISILQIVPNRFQPRKQFTAGSINELAQTIAAHGLLQPIILREYAPDHYEIIAGERRYRAVQSLGWAEISAIVKQMTDQESAEMAVIENLQREDLNPIDEAAAYQSLLDTTHGTQAQLAQRLGKSQSYLANQLRLLKLPAEAQQAIVNGQITPRHGRALLKLDAITQAIVLKQILADHLTVGQTDQLIAQLSAPDATQTAKPTTQEKTGTANSAQPAAKDDPQNGTGAHRLTNAAKKIKQSLKQIQSAGNQVQFTEKATADHYTITIEVSVANSAENEEEN
ncbi:ParB/RepB/Spo0J family partition protein [Lapidilactobacillus mulanensis]|uniref:ParB/RepB/Spo0J family partition protein n=1 Tax=Lapidilactobacillus mulanensis TaxID=2485999 RepID=A0ABW4DPL5_9LACO|nr:ParB/RepB/Spo0J family partition protein [Lapidilactobacillus mulanensis]